MKAHRHHSPEYSEQPFSLIMQYILVLTSTYPRWNNDTEPSFVHLLCKELIREYRVIVLAPHYLGARQQEEIDGIQVHRFRYFPTRYEKLAYGGGIISNLKASRLKYLLVPFFLISQLYSIRILCKKYPINLIHAHWVIPQGFLAVAARQIHLINRNIKILCTSHGGDLFSLQGSLQQTLKCYAIKHSDHVTVVSTAMRNRLIDMSCGTDNVTVQSMGVDLRTQFIPGANKSVTRDIVYVGRLVEKKGVSTLLDAIKLLSDQHPNITVSLVGDGPERRALEDQSKRLGIDKQVKFLGSLPNHQVPGIYQSAKIAVVPSVIAADGDQEGLGLVAVEALGCGCATIVSDLPALADVVTHGENGLVFQSGNAIDLCHQIETILGDEVLYRQLSRQARLSVIEKFDWQTVGTRYKQIIEKTQLR